MSESIRPNLSTIWRKTPLLLRPLAPIEWIASWLFYAVSISAALRLVLEIAAALAILVGIAGFLIDLQARNDERSAAREERLTRMWNVATQERAGNSGKVPALEYLHVRRHTLQGIQIPEAYLRNLDLAPYQGWAARLSDVDFSGADLSDASLDSALLTVANLESTTLVRASLQDARLINANLTGADMTGANLSNARLWGTDFTNARMLNTNLTGALFSAPGDDVQATGLTQSQLDSACADPNRPPRGFSSYSNGAHELEWRERPCTGTPQEMIANYQSARESFWGRLYAEAPPGIRTLYCGAPLDFDRRLHLEHVYARSWISSNRKRRDDSTTACPADVLQCASSDLHNIWPTLAKANISRRNSRFDELSSESTRSLSDECPNFEIQIDQEGGSRRVEPRDDAKGDIARTILYMADVYELPTMIKSELLMSWDKQDPPDHYEIWRNNKIQSIQGTRNHFIDAHRLKQ